jgi:DNA processing protein
LGCGIDVPYPRENRPLIDDMIGSGAVISEFRPGMPPLATNFYRRNRIVSGLVKGVVVVQATRNSGSLITASHALDQNRDVFAVPGNVMDSRSWGPHSLLKQGAGLVESAEDILTSLFAPPPTVKPQRSLFASEESRDQVVSDVAEQVLQSLDPDPVPIDILCESLKIEVGKLSGILLELELRGLVRQHPGKMFSRILH